MKKNNKAARLRAACFLTYPAMASVFSLPPLLFVTFHGMYGISYTFLGTLLLVNFCTQLVIDLVFTFFSHRFNIPATLRVMPLITTAGLVIYALVPWLIPSAAKTGLIAGTIIFSVSTGLSEVLISPTVAVIPSEHPDRDMSLLHSLYGWGVFAVVLVSSVFFRLFDRENWMYLTLFFAVLPLIASYMFFTSEIPEISTGQEKGKSGKGKYAVIALCAVIIFLGSGSENIMTGWISSFAEKALFIPKTTGDILGTAIFALCLALARSIYAKYGKNILKTLIVSMAGAAVCYLTAGISENRIICLIACVATGLFTSMLWPGTLILMEENAPGAGVAAYALMAAAGDFGASVGPQLTGILVDKIAFTRYAADKAVALGSTAEAVGLKSAMLSDTFFPVAGLLFCVAFYFIIKKPAEKHKLK